jgi:hypothetical protein
MTDDELIRRVEKLDSVLNWDEIHAIVEALRAADRIAQLTTNTDDLPNAETLGPLLDKHIKKTSTSTRRSYYRQTAEGVLAAIRDWRASRGVPVEPTSNKDEPIPDRYQALATSMGLQAETVADLMRSGWTLSRDRNGPTTFLDPSYRLANKSGPGVGGQQ